MRSRTRGSLTRPGGAGTAEGLGGGAGRDQQSVLDTAPVFEAILAACQRCSAAKKSASTRSATTRWSGRRHGIGPRAEEARGMSRRLPKASPAELSGNAAPTTFLISASFPICSLRCANRWTATAARRFSMRRCCEEDSGLGSILVVRWPPRPFSNPEQALLQTFCRSGGDRDPERTAIPGGPGSAQTTVRDQRHSRHRLVARRCASRFGKVGGQACRLCGVSDAIVLLREGDDLQYRGASRADSPSPEFRQTADQPRLASRARRVRPQARARPRPRRRQGRFSVAIALSQRLRRGASQAAPCRLLVEDHALDTPAARERGASWRHCAPPRRRLAVHRLRRSRSSRLSPTRR